MQNVECTCGASQYIVHLWGGRNWNPLISLCTFFILPYFPRFMSLAQCAAVHQLPRCSQPKLSGTRQSFTLMIPLMFFYPSILLYFFNPSHFPAMYVPRMFFLIHCIYITLTGNTNSIYWLPCIWVCCLICIHILFALQARLVHAYLLVCHSLSSFFLTSFNKMGKWDLNILFTLPVAWIWLVHNLITCC